MRVYVDGVDFDELRAEMERSSRLWRIMFDGLDAQPGTMFAVTSATLGWNERRFFCWETDAVRFGLQVANED
jgi:hypothetical protein